MPTLRYTLCDVFTDRPLTGNALAGFTDAARLDPQDPATGSQEPRACDPRF